MEWQENPTCLIFPSFFKNFEICLISFSLQAAFKIILNPFSVFVTIKSSIIPPVNDIVPFIFSFSKVILSDSLIDSLLDKFLDFEDEVLSNYYYYNDDFSVERTERGTLDSFNNNMIPVIESNLSWNKEEMRKNVGHLFLFMKGTWQYSDNGIDWWPAVEEFGEVA